MKKIDPTVRKETGYIALCTLILSVLMEAIFLIARFWDLTVLWGNLVSAGAGILNFFLMGLTVQTALTKEEKKAKQLMRLSQSLRLLGLFALIAVAASLPCFNKIALLVPLIFPRLAILARPLIGKKKQKEEEDDHEA